MYWTAKLGRALGFGRNTILPEQFFGNDGQILINETLLKNPAVHGDQAIVKQLVSVGKTVFFRKGDKIIQQGGQDNDVFFLLSGEVDIVFKSQKGSIREAPNQVGEMAAIELGKKRSANVVARSQEVAALQVPGIDFNKIWTANPRFQQLLQVEMSARHRERIVAGTIAKENNSFIWFAISMSAGLVAGLATYYFPFPSDWTTSARSILSCSSGLMMFLLTLLHNPAFFWRRTFRLVLLAMIGTHALGRYISIETKQGLGSLQIGINSGDSRTDWKMVISFLVVLALCAYMDKVRTKD